MLFFGPPNIEKLKAKRDVKGLIKALGYQKDYFVRKAAAMALGEIMDPRAIKPLIAVFKERRSDIQREIAAALIDIFARHKDDMLRAQVVEKFIQELMDWNKSISDVERRMKDMEKKNPFLEKFGFMLSEGQEIENRFGENRFETTYAGLGWILSSFSQSEAEWIARLSALTGKNFKRSSEWDEWFRKEYK